MGAAAIRSDVKKTKVAKGRPATAGGHGKTESNFVRYRRQSAYSIADEKKKVAAANEPVDTKEQKKVRIAMFSNFARVTTLYKLLVTPDPAVLSWCFVVALNWLQPKARPRRLSVGWGDMATLLGNTGFSPVDEQSDEWWSTPEGERVKLKCVVLSIASLLIHLYLPVYLCVTACRHNTINVDRIHLKIAETNVVKRLLELVFDDTPHVSEYAVAGEFDASVASCMLLLGLSV